MARHRPISNNDLWTKYEPRDNPADGGSVWQWEQVRNENPAHVWTLVDSDTRHQYAVPGFHFVNRFGYIVTKQPWKDDARDAVWS
jgi:hypothetical protein